MKRKLALIIALAVLLAAVGVVALNPGAMRFFRREAVISLAGDLMLDRGVGRKIAQNGRDYPFEAVSGLFLRDEVTIANLECPLTRAENAKDKEVVFKAAPESAAALKAAGFDALMLANNHSSDYFDEGLKDTVLALEGTGLFYAGNLDGKGEARPCIIEKNGVRIGILAYNALEDEGQKQGGGEGAAYVSSDDTSKMQGEVRETAARCDFLIVYFHWGVEYLSEVSCGQIKIAHAAADSGASLVVGTHPHVLQGRENYKGVPIYYSLGNFVFDWQVREGTDEGVVLQLTVGKRGLKSISELPVIIENCRPVIAEGERAAKIRGDLKRYSQCFES